MIIIYAETRYVWSCPDCLKTSTFLGDYRYKSEIKCECCGAIFTKFRGECDEEESGRKIKQ